MNLVDIGRIAEKDTFEAMASMDEYNIKLSMLILELDTLFFH